MVLTYVNTKTKIIWHVHAGRRADFFCGVYQLETRFARIKINGPTSEQDISLHAPLNSCSTNSRIGVLRPVAADYGLAEQRTKGVIDRYSILRATNLVHWIDLHRISRKCEGSTPEFKTPWTIPRPIVDIKQQAKYAREGVYGVEPTAVKATAQPYGG